MKKNINYYGMVFVLFFLLCSTVKSLTYGGCSYSEITRLKNFISNINISYDYYEYGKDVYFYVTINNIVPGIFFVDSQTEKKYKYDDSIDGELVIMDYTGTGGSYKFYSDLSNCYGIALGTKYYKFPTYNRYYNSDLCNNNKNYNLCQKWQNVTYSYSEFEKILKKYNEGKEEIVEEEIESVYEQSYVDMLIKFYIEYYYIILIGIIVVCVLIMIINKKRNSFDL